MHLLHSGATDDPLQAVPALTTLPIAVVIPAYNAEAYLAEAVASVRAQTIPPQEIIVVDDGSSDGTRELAHQLEVTLIEQKNSGVSVARNTGVRMANSPWVAFLDADDVWEPAKLERQWRALQAVPASFMCFTGSSYFNERGALPGGLDTIPDFKRVRLIDTGIVNTYLCESGSYARTLARVNFIVHAAILISREVFLQTGGYDESMHYSEDLDWILRAATLTPVVLVDEPLTRIRTHTTNSSRNWDRMIISHIEVGIKAEYRPDAYPAGVAAEFMRLRPAFYNEAGLCLLRSLAVSEARQRFVQSWQHRPNLRAALFIAMARIAEQPWGAGLLQYLRTFAKRRMEERHIS